MSVYVVGIWKEGYLSMYGKHKVIFFQPFLVSKLIITLIVKWELDLSVSLCSYRRLWCKRERVLELSNLDLILNFQSGGVSGEVLRLIWGDRRSGGQGIRGSGVQGIGTWTRNWELKQVVIVNVWLKFYDWSALTHLDLVNRQHTCVMKHIKKQIILFTNVWIQ